MMAFKLPSLGADMDEGTLLEWRVAPGQAVHKGDVIAVVDTSKAAVDIEVWENATVAALLVEVGQKIPVGTVMAQLLRPGETGRETPEVALPPLPGRAPPVPGLRPVNPSPAPYFSASTGPRLRASPAARQLAAQRGVAMEALVGSGPDGVIVRADVASAPPTSTASTPLPASLPTHLSPTGPAQRAVEMRKVIAAAMSRSKREIPHYYLAEPIPLRHALAWLQARNADRAVTARILPVVLLLKAVALAVKAVPEMNGYYLNDGFQPSAAVHLGVAISLRGGGLVAPALHDVASKPLDLLMRELDDLVLRCRAGHLRSSELSDPTLTVTNLGDQGVAEVQGVIYPPQVALVGFGRVTEQAWVEAGQLTVMPLVTASLAGDHRASDGHRGALFLRRLREHLQTPEQL
jgi:pyruvate dehydrogenase E2 component (dihydrolipoamide acetyltransferase)